MTETEQPPTLSAPLPPHGPTEPSADAPPANADSSPAGPPPEGPPADGPAAAGACTEEPAALRPEDVKPGDRVELRLRGFWVPAKVVATTGRCLTLWVSVPGLTQVVSGVTIGSTIRRPREAATTTA